MNAFYLIFYRLAQITYMHANDCIDTCNILKLLWFELIIWITLWILW